MDKIILKEIRFHGYHGVAEAERQIGQKYEIDAELMCDLSAAGKTDDLSHTIDYAAVVRLLVGIGTQQSFQLIEALAETLASEIFDRFPVDEVGLTVRKLLPPVEQMLTYVSVEIHRKRKPNG